MKHYLLLFLLYSLLFSNCGTNTKTVDSDSSQLESISNQMDSTAYRPDTTSAVKLLKFSSAQQAIDYMKKSGHWDQYSRGIIPQMAEECLEYAEKLLNNTHPRFIICDKSKMQVGLYNKYGVLEKEYGMACARNYGTKHRKADSRTPEGFFSVEGIYNSTDWLFTNDAGYTSPAKGQFGPRFIRVRTPVSMQIGIHGTSAPWSIGRRASHGCMRLTNENILDLVKYVEADMPVIINPGATDKAVNEKEGYHVPQISSGMSGKVDVVDRNKVERATAAYQNAKADSANSDSAANNTSDIPVTDPTTTPIEDPIIPNESQPSEPPISE